MNWKYDKTVKVVHGTFQRHLTAGSVRKWPSQIFKGLWIKTCCFSGKERRIVSQYWSESLWLSDWASEHGEGLRFYSSWGLLCPTLVTRRKKTSFSNITTVSFFLIFIQLRDSKKIHYLIGEFRVKLHLKTDMVLIASRLVRYRFSCAI